MSGLFQDLLDRRVPQVVALYLGGSWAVIEFMAFLEDRFLLSPHLTNLVLALLALLLTTFATVHTARVTAVLAAEALDGLVHGDAVLHEVPQVAFDLLFVDTEVGGEFLGTVFETHRPGVRGGVVNRIPCRVSGLRTRAVEEVAGVSRRVIRIRRRRRVPGTPRGRGRRSG